MMQWQWHQLDYITCTSLQTDNHASTSSLNFFTGWMPFLTPSQQCQSTEGIIQNSPQTKTVEQPQSFQWIVDCLSSYVLVLPMTSETDHLSLWHI